MHGRLTRWSTSTGLWRRWSNGRVVEWPVTYVKLWKGWRMSCDVGKTTEGLENERWRRRSHGKGWILILQPFRYFTYVTAHSPTVVSLHLHHRLFTYITWRVAHAASSRNGWVQHVTLWYFVCSEESVCFRTWVPMQNLTVLVLTTSPRNL